jgi:hypothetical protein
MFVEIVTKDHGVIEVNRNLICSIRPYHQYGLRDEFNLVVTMMNGDSYKISRQGYEQIKGIT